MLALLETLYAGKQGIGTSGLGLRPFVRNDLQSRKYK